MRPRRRRARPPRRRGPRASRRGRRRCTRSCRTPRSRRRHRLRRLERGRLVQPAVATLPPRTSTDTSDPLGRARRAPASSSSRIGERRGAEDHALARRPRARRRSRARVRSPPPNWTGTPSLAHDARRCSRLTGAPRGRRRGRPRAGAGAPRGPFPRGRRAVARVLLLRVEVALHQAHGAAVEDVDRRVEDHAADARTGRPRGAVRAKLASSRSPPREDFSGWNCTP